MIHAYQHVLPQLGHAPPGGRRARTAYPLGLLTQLCRC